MPQIKRQLGWLDWVESLLKYWNDEIRIAEIANAHGEASRAHDELLHRWPVPDPDSYQRPIDDELNAARGTL